MTKSEELQRLDAFIADMTPDSYLGPWLAGIRSEIETDLRNDIFPTVTPRETWLRCQAIRKEASDHIRRELERKRDDARRILDQAKAEAKRTTDRAEAQADEIRRHFQQNILQLRQALNAVA